MLCATTPLSDSLTLCRILPNYSSFHRAGCHTEGEEDDQRSTPCVPPSSFLATKGGLRLASAERNDHPGISLPGGFPVIGTAWLGSLESCVTFRLSTVGIFPFCLALQSEPHLCILPRDNLTILPACKKEVHLADLQPSGLSPYIDCGLLRVLNQALRKSTKRGLDA